MFNYSNLRKILIQIYVCMICNKTDFRSLVAKKAYIAQVFLLLFVFYATLCILQFKSHNIHAQDKKCT